MNNARTVRFACPRVPINFKIDPMARSINKRLRAIGLRCVRSGQAGIGEGLSEFIGVCRVTHATTSVTVKPNSAHAW